MSLPAFFRARLTEFSRTLFRHRWIGVAGEYVLLWSCKQTIKKREGGRYKALRRKKIEEVCNRRAGTQKR